MLSIITLFNACQAFLLLLLFLFVIFVIIFYLTHVVGGFRSQYRESELFFFLLCCFCFVFVFLLEI